MEMQLWCQGINNSLGLPVSQQWGQHETDTHTADTAAFLMCLINPFPLGLLLARCGYLPVA